MNINLIKLCVFASLAIGIKLLSAWSPIDIMLAFGLWVGCQMKGKSVLIKSAYVAFLAATVVFSDWVFAVTTHRTFFYDGIWLNELALISSCVIPLLSQRMLRPAWGLLGISSAVLVFFVISNLGVFFFSPLYPHTWSGLMGCFVAALPFVKLQWMSNALATTSLTLTQQLISAGHWHTAGNTK